MPEPRLSETELYIMRLFWQHGPMKSESLAVLVAERSWKSTTLLTFLSRLAAKGILRVEKQGKSNLYSPLISEQEYLHQESKIFLDQMYGGSARDFLAAMVDSRGITKNDLAELKDWLSRQEGADND